MKFENPKVITPSFRMPTDEGTYELEVNLPFIPQLNTSIQIYDFTVKIEDVKLVFSDDECWHFFTTEYVIMDDHRRKSLEYQGWELISSTPCD